MVSFFKLNQCVVGNGGIHREKSEITEKKLSYVISVSGGGTVQLLVRYTSIHSSTYLLICGENNNKKNSTLEK